ncbi:MAG: hypothetical protein ACI9R3_005316, partial [Verrucomicrobiales bacterium]
GRQLGGNWEAIGRQLGGNWVGRDDIEKIVTSLLLSEFGKLFPSYPNGRPSKREWLSSKNM